MKKNIKAEDKEKMYVYLLPSVLCGLIVPAEVEEAIKVGFIKLLFIDFYWIIYFII